MLVSGIQLVDQAACCELHALIKCDTHWVWGDDPFPLWYRFPQQCRQYLNVENGDPFVAACLLPAMLLGEPLEIPAPVSEKLLRALPGIQALYCSWDSRLSPIDVKAPSRTSALTNSSLRNTGIFFSLGVDSFYSLLKSIASHSGDDEAITHLIHVLGFDIYLWEMERYPKVLANLNHVAEQTGKQLVAVATNLRDLSDRLVDWVALYHGAALASVGLSLGAMFREIRIAASLTFDQLKPLGTHPALDPLWSTEHLSFVHDGCEAERLEKIRVIAQSPVALATLRVCAADDTSGVYNCGVCRKCLTTMLGLHAAGALEKCNTLPNTIDPALVREIPAETSTGRALLQRLSDALGSSEQDVLLKSALAERLARP